MRPEPSHHAPDPALGVFETLLVVDGRPVELEAHLARLASSVRQLYGAESGDEARRRILESARGLTLGRLRLDVRPREDHSIALSAAVRRVEASLVLSPDIRPAGLRSSMVSDGLGPHKWADRSLLEQLEAETENGQGTGDGLEATPLLVDREGAALETARANLFMVQGDRLVTPPADGRILPGTVRARVLEMATAIGLEPVESNPTRDDLLEADGVFLTGSVRGVVGVRDLDGAPLPGGGDFSRRAARELRRRWFG